MTLQEDLDRLEAAQREFGQKFVAALRPLIERTLAAEQKFGQAVVAQLRKQ